MSPPFASALARWLDVRPGEGRSVALACAGAFLVMAALTLGRALREGLYLDAFAMETLPYVTAAVALLGLPLAGRFSRALARTPTWRVLSALILIEVVGLGLLTLLGGLPAWRRPAIVLFYLWTALGLLLLGSGFWVMTGGIFPLRGAKRLYGLVSAGGTAGAMVAGLSLGALAEGHDARLLVLPLALILLAVLGLVLVQRRAGEQAARAADGAAPRGARAGFRSLWSNPHLRVIGLLVICATGASTLLDYQFKEAARAASAAAADPAGALTGFLGTFYGVTGAIALAFQLLVSGRLLARAGIGAALAVLPLLLLVGAAGFALLPGLLVITLTRGGDNALRKSLFRPALEVLFVPLPERLRRSSKSLVDSTLDALAEGAGAGLIFLWVTLAGFSSRWLSLGVALLAGAFLWLSRRMDRVYLRTVVERLEEGEAGLTLPGAGLGSEAELSATFTRLDLGALLERRESAPSPRRAGEATLASQLGAAETADVLAAIAHLDAEQGWDEPALAQLVRLLARDPLMETAATRLEAHCERAMALMVAAQTDPAEEFIIRRRLPRVLGRCGDVRADDALLEALSADRFEIRYRAARALTRRRRHGLPPSTRDRDARIWAALRLEVTRERPIWELQKLLDAAPTGGEGDELVLERAELRGGRSLEHAFRLMSLVLDPQPVRAAFHGIVQGRDDYRGFAQEYLEQVLPADIRERLWLFIGDLSQEQQRARRRSLQEVVGDLLNSHATLFADESQQRALRRLLEDTDEGQQ